LLTDGHHSLTKEKSRERFRKDERSFLWKTSARLRCNQSSSAKHPPQSYYGAAGTKKRQKNTEWQSASFSKASAGQEKPSFFEFAGSIERLCALDGNALQGTRNTMDQGFVLGALRHLDGQVDTRLRLDMKVNV